MTAERRPRSAWLLVGVTPLTVANVHRSRIRRMKRGTPRPAETAVRHEREAPATWRGSLARLRAIEADADFERAIDAVEWGGVPGIDPLVHESMTNPRLIWAALAGSSRSSRQRHPQLPIRTPTQQRHSRRSAGLVDWNAAQAGVMESSDRRSRSGARMRRLGEQRHSKRITVSGADGKRSLVAAAVVLSGACFAGCGSAKSPAPAPVL